jgi:hypothetical protein
MRGDPTKPMVYGLAGRGAEALVEQGWLDDIGDCQKENRGLGERYIAHQAMITNFRIALTVAIRERRDVQLLFFKPETLALRDRVTVGVDGRSETIPINPDGYFGLQFPELPEGRNRAFFFLEADRSTMTRERFLQKLRGYWEWFQQGGHTRKHDIRAFRVLTVTKSEERMISLLQATACAKELGGGQGIFWFTSENRFTATPASSIFSAIWEIPAGAGGAQSILPSGVAAPCATTDGFSRETP